MERYSTGKDDKHFLISISGPTAIGKTALAIDIARHFNTEIISSDSRQFFRELSIGTAKPSQEELAQAVHHFINSHSVNDPMDAGIFERQAIALLHELFKKHHVVVMVGGSGLYTDAVLKGLDELPAADEELRASLNSLTLEELQQELQSLDPEFYLRIDVMNRQRLMRALEICKTSGKTNADLRKNTPQKRNFEVIKIALDTSRDILYERINKRVDRMMSDGLPDEVRSLLPFKNCYALQTVGYAELFDHLDGKITLGEAVEKIKQNTRRFAKRQLTWLRRDEEISWFRPEQKEEIIQHIHKITGPHA